MYSSIYGNCKCERTSHSINDFKIAVGELIACVSFACWCIWLHVCKAERSCRRRRAASTSLFYICSYIVTWTWLHLCWLAGWLARLWCGTRNNTTHTHTLDIHITIMHNRNSEMCARALDLPPLIIITT